MTTAKFAKHLRFNSNQRKTNSGMHLSVFLLRLHMQGGMINWRIWLTVDVAEPAVWASPQLSLWLRQNGVCVCVCVIASFASSGGDALQAITVLCIIYSECARVCWADDLQRNKLLRWAQQFCGTISIVLADVCASWNFVHDRATSSARAIELRPECTHHNIALDTFSISSIKSCSPSQQQQQIHLNQQNTCVLFDVGNGVEWRRS